MNALAGGPTNARDAELLERYGCYSGTRSAFCQRLAHPRRYYRARRRAYVGTSASPNPETPACATQILRSVSDNHVFVVCRDGAFYELVPEDVRKQGPLAGSCSSGEIAEPQATQYRLALARDGYALVKCEPAVFKPEA